MTDLITREDTINLDILTELLKVNAACKKPVEVNTLIEDIRKIKASLFNGTEKEKKPFGFLPLN